MNIPARTKTMHVHPQAYKALTTEAFIRNLQATVISYCKPTYNQEETAADKSFNDLSSITIQILKHNVLVFREDFNTHLKQDEGYRFV